METTLTANELWDLFEAGMNYYEKNGRRGRYRLEERDRSLVEALLVILNERHSSREEGTILNEETVRDAFGLYPRRAPSTIVLRER